MVDIRMPPTFTDEDTRAARSIKDTYPSLGVLVLSQHIDTNHAFALVSRPGFGYLLKDRVLNVGDFLAAAQRVADGGSALDPQVVGALIAASRDDPLALPAEALAHTDRLPSPTPRPDRDDRVPDHHDDPLDALRLATSTPSRRG